MIKVGRFQKGISLNPLEFLLDSPKGKIIKFTSKKAAKSYLRQHGVNSKDDLEDDFRYVNDEGQEV